MNHKKVRFQNGKGETMIKSLNSFKPFGLKRKLSTFCPIEDFFELHSIATE